MEVVKENKIKQILKADIKREDKEYKILQSTINDFFEKVLKQKVEGTIEAIDITSYSYGEMSIKLSTIKEDKLKMIEDKTIVVKKNDMSY